MATICFYARFEDSAGDGSNGLTVTWDVERITRSDGTRAALVTGGANSITVGRRGLYGYVLTNADLTLYDYVATAITASATPTSHEVAAIWTLWSLSWHDVATAIMTVVGSFGLYILTYLDAKVSSISAVVGGSTTLKAGDLPDMVRWTTYQSGTINATIPATYTKVRVSIKRAKDDTEDEALVRIVVSNPAVPATDGLERINGATPVSQGLTVADGSITVDEANDQVSFVVSDEAMSLLECRSDVHYDVKVEAHSGTTTRAAYGNLNIVLTPTRAL